jgi:hypothetical protein
LAFPAPRPAVAGEEDRSALLTSIDVAAAWGGMICSLANFFAEPASALGEKATTLFDERRLPSESRR